MSVFNNCDDCMLEAIEKAREELINGTNIEDSPDEMAVIDDVLFRCWQIGLLDAKDEVRQLKGENLQLRMLAAAYSDLASAMYRYWGIDKDSDALDEMKRVDKEVQILRDELGVEVDDEGRIRSSCRYPQVGMRDAGRE